MSAIYRKSSAAVEIAASQVDQDAGYASQTNAMRGGGAVGLNRRLDGAGPGTVAYKLRAHNDSRDYQVPFDGSADAQPKLQELMNSAWAALYYQNQVWVGVDTLGANPVAKIAPGRYKMQNSLTVGTGSSVAGFAHPANTVSHTRLIMDSTASGGGAGDNRGKPIMRFNRATMNNGGLANGGFTGALQNLEFWYVTGSNDFQNPLGGASIPYKAYPSGGSLFIDVDMLDMRIKDCCFQHGPAAIRGLNVPRTNTVRGDGWPGSYGVNVYVSGCEFDAAPLHLWFTNCHLDLEFDNCAFYGGVSLFENCTGRVKFSSSCRFYGGARIEATDAANNFDEFICDAHFSDQALGNPSIAVRNAAFLGISSRMRGATGASSVVAIDCADGLVNPVIQDSGYNASPGTNGNDFTAAVKLIGCGLVASPCIGVFATAGNYNGFGLLTLDAADAPAYGAAHASKVIVDGAIVKHPYNATPFRFQDRSINTSPGDIVRWSHNAVRPGEAKTNRGLNVGGSILVPNGQIYGQAATYDLATFAESGVFLVTVETQYANNLALINSGTFKVTRRAAGGLAVEQLGLSNLNNVSGVISLAGSVLSFTYGGGTPFYLAIKSNRIADGGVE